MRKIIQLLCIGVIFLFFIACSKKGEAYPQIAAYVMRDICQGQKMFFNKYGRYGLLIELYNEGLVHDDTRNHRSILSNDYYGYIFEIKVVVNGYVAKATPIGFGTNQSIGKTTLYLDETIKNIKARHDDTFAGPKDENFQVPDRPSESALFCCTPPC